MDNSKLGRYEMIEDGREKFWTLQKVGDDYVARWGKIGGSAEGLNGPSKTYSEDEIDKVIQSKLNKGYEKI